MKGFAPLTREERDRVRELVPLVKAVVMAMSFRRPFRIGARKGELTGWGCLGLIRAFRRYDESVTIPFEIFVRLHIRSAILNGLKREQTAQRRLLLFAQQAGYTTAAETSNGWDAATDGEEQARAKLDAAANELLGAMHLAVGGGLGDDRGEDAMLAWFENRFATAALNRGWATLDERQRAVLDQVFVKDASYAEAAAALDISIKAVRHHRERGLEALGAFVRAMGVTGVPETR